MAILFFCLNFINVMRFSQLIHSMHFWPAIIKSETRTPWRSNAEHIFHRDPMSNQSRLLFLEEKNICLGKCWDHINTSFYASDLSGSQLMKHKRCLFKKRWFWCFFFKKTLRTEKNSSKKNELFFCFLDYFDMSLNPYGRSSSYI